ncbi:MAG: hypothetical protein PHD76_06585 [Methylacidiphilales bacterium]|nr:hypothetical protein [Candidatus Methylacidiphilales bacterium]
MKYFLFLLFPIIFCQGQLVIAAEEPAITAHAPSASCRLAVISTSETADLAALLTTELSGNPDILLVERDELAKVADELKLQQMAGKDAVALGKLVGADGLLFISKTPDGLQVRFTAVGLGYALFDDPSPPKDNLPELAKSIAHRVTGYAPKLKLDPTKAIPISVLNLRADYGTAQSLQVERNLTLLLESRLTSVPEYVVLERRHAWSLGFEHSLNATSKPLLKGAYLIDGTISMAAPGDTCSVALRLREPRGDEKKTMLQGDTKNLGALVDQILAEIKKDMGQPFSNSGLTAIPEANEYLREALWGLRANVPAAALEAVDSAELLGAAPEKIVPLRIQILCLISEQGMEKWHPPELNGKPTFDSDTLAAKTEVILRALSETVRYRDQKLEAKPEKLAPSNGPETSQTIATVSYKASKILVLLERAQSPRANELRHTLRTLTGYDPQNGKSGAVQPGNVSLRENVAYIFADDWAQTIEEEIAWLRLICNDNQQALPKDSLKDPSQTFCARLLTTPKEREKAFDDFVESLKNNPDTKRTYLVLKTHVKDAATADAAYLEYLNYLLASRQELSTCNDYSPLVESVWDIASEVKRRDAKASLPIVHAVLDEEHPGNSGIIILKNLWQPTETDLTDASAIWKEEQDYVKRRTDVVIQKHGLPDLSFIAEMDSIMYYFKSKFPNVVNANAATDTNSTPPLVITQFWHPWLVPSTPVDNNIIITATSVANDQIWVASYLNILEKGRIFKIHLPDLQTETVDTMDGKYIQGLLWTPQALYAPMGSDETLQGLRQQLARYDFSTSSWTKRDLPVSYSSQYLYGVNGDIYLPTGSRQGAESGLVKYNWDADKVTLLADNRRRPAQNQFDDTSTYRVISIFAGPGNKPSVTTGDGTYFIQESPGTWPPVFDGACNDYVVSVGDQSLVFNWEGEAMFIDPKMPSPIPWMAADEPIYRKAKTSPVTTPWASQTIWDCPPGKRKQMDERTVAFHDGRLFILFKPSTFENRYELLCYDKARGRKPVRIPLKMQLTASAKAALSLHPGRAPNGWSLDDIEQPNRLYEPELKATKQGLCLVLPWVGFWFVPYTHIEAYFKAHLKVQSDSVTSTTIPINTPKIMAKPTVGNDVDPGDLTSFR